MKQQTGRKYWRSLDELADDPAFRAAVEGEFPAGFFDQIPAPSRRRFLQMLGASVALAGLAGLGGCRRWETRQLAPHSARPEGQAPGQTERYATAFELSGIARPVMLTSYDGRPIKVEGNPAHPASRGAADAISQASVLELYDPERSQRFRRRADGKTYLSTREKFLATADGLFGHLRDHRGQGLAILAEATNSPTIAALRKHMADVLPEACWHTYEPINRSNELAGAKVAFGQCVRTRLHLDNAQVIAVFDCDLLGSHPAALTSAADWAHGRRSADAASVMNRMYVVEGVYTVTGGAADHRLPVRPSRIGHLLAEVARRLNGQQATADPDPRAEAFVSSLVKDLLSHRGRSVLVAGPQQPPEVHALVHQLNADLGNAGTTVTYTQEPDSDRPADVDAIRQLADDLRGGKVDTLLILGGNPVYDAPADARLHEALGHAKTSIHLSLYDNETSRACTWHAPRAHWLEAWGDARSYDGTVSVVQPLIQPLYDGISALELLGRLVDVRSDADGRKHTLEHGYDIVRETFRGILPAATFDRDWQRMLYAGLLEGSAYPAVTPTLRQNLVDLPEVRRLFTDAASPDKELEAVFVPGHGVYDGRFANNGWLQELPDPVTKLTWDNAALISPTTARSMGISNGDLLSIRTQAGAIEIVAMITPGTAPGVVGLTLGYGRTAAGHVGDGVGFNVYPLRAAASAGARIVELTRTGRTYPLAITEQYSAIETSVLEEKFKERVGELLREGTLEEYRAHPRFAQHLGPHVPSDARHVPLQLWQEPLDYDKAASQQWGMTIDLNACIGCNACVIACQAENNIPIVGKQEVARGRQMHWIRVDRYFSGEAEAPSLIYQPVSCHHCENAPCEQVCPAGATVHDSEGLNVMVYNRCVGTRYCSNNCPYKVRRFNYFDWHSRDPRKQGMTAPYIGLPDQQQNHTVDAIRRMVFNPGVSVRMRGVMEKCTYCVQRIKAAEQVARTQHAAGQRPDTRLRDGEVVPACAQTCPTQAITFGNLKDPLSRVRKLQKDNPRSYGMLAELNVRPRTTYLAKLTNPAEKEQA